MDKQIQTAVARVMPATVLGQRATRIPIGGKIRAGIKVLTRAAAGNPRVQALYDEGVAQQASFEEIGQQITSAFPELKAPLVPKNVAWFTVRPGDFPNPAIATQILDAYGEDRGDGVKRLYRFPVVFPADSWQAVMPHELAAWNRSEKRYWSEYSPDGHTRYCRMHAPVKIDQVSRRPIRTFGGRPTQLRPENNGLCDPEHCPEFQNRLCNLSGRFIFYIPGIRSLDAIELQTNSFYALSRAIERFETIAFMRGGRLSGFLDRQRTPFYLTKKLRDVSHIDPRTGQPVRTAHWIIELEAPVDVTALLPQDELSTLRQADDAVRLLQGESIEPAEFPQPAPGDAQTPTHESEPPVTTATARTERRDEPSEAKATSKDKPDGELAAIYAVASSYGVDQQRLDAYADWHWGAGWRRNAGGRNRLLAQLRQYEAQPEQFVALVAAEIGEPEPATLDGQKDAERAS